MPTPALDVVALQEEQIDAAGHLIARAFQHEPMFVYTFPDPVERAHYLPAYFAWNVRHGYLFGKTYGTTAPLRAAAIVFPSGDDIWSEERMQQSGFDRLGEVVGSQAMEQFVVVQDLVINAEADLYQIVTDPHWHLDAIAVEPAQQGTGLGGIVIEAIHTDLAASNLPITLITDEARTVRFYLRHGYEIVCEGTEPVSKIHHWGMNRPPRGV